MPKSPFEKIKSLVERRKLFEGLLREQTEVLCKGDEETLFHIKPTAIVGESVMQGYMIALEKVADHDAEIIGNFSVASDRYFFRTQIKVSGSEVSFPLNSDVYKLQRRASLRLNVPSNLGIYFAITEFNGKPNYAIAQIADLSAGGARIFFSAINAPIPIPSNVLPIAMTAGDRFKGVLHMASQKNLNLEAEVKHVQQSAYYGQVVDQMGVEFVELSPRLQNRLISMSMDLQRRLAVEF